MPVQKLSAGMPTELEFLPLEAAPLVGMLDTVSRLQRRSGRLAREAAGAVAAAERSVLIANTMVPIIFFISSSFLS
jgi:hypothetical protein